jgi:hypothetical protein
MRPLLLLCAVGSFAPAVCGAEPLRFASGPARVALIELYTSEGCSSCPPAERWLGARRDDPGLWKNFVPVAFHVDYWNRLGWPDRFSTREFTQRQSALAAGWASDSVYTPCFARDGAEWRPAGEATVRRDPGAAAGTLAIVIDGAKVRAEFTPAAARAKESFELHVALLGGGLVSKVTAGENSGTTLRQEFVALALATHPLAADGAVHGAEFALPSSAMKDAARRSLAAWVTRRGELVPVQAVGGWLAP